MTDKALKLIFEYMKERGWDYTYYTHSKDEGTSEYTHPFDSNTAYECVQEMERKGDWDEFIIFYMNEFELSSLSDMPHFMIWSTNPTNFFTYFFKWLEDKQNRYSDGTKIFPNRNKT